MGHGTLVVQGEIPLHRCGLACNTVTFSTERRECVSPELSINKSSALTSLLPRIRDPKHHPRLRGPHKLRCIGNQSRSRTGLGSRTARAPSCAPMGLPITANQRFTSFAPTQPCTFWHSEVRESRRSSLSLQTPDTVEQQLSIVVL